MKPFVWRIRCAKFLYIRHAMDKTFPLPSEITRLFVSQAAEILAKEGISAEVNRC
jgi:hypothetical protein